MTKKNIYKWFKFCCIDFWGEEKTQKKSRKLGRTSYMFSEKMMRRYQTISPQKQKKQKLIIL